METAAAVEKQNPVFPQQLAKRLLAFRTVSTGTAAMKPKTTKPDRSLATKTGHFYLLPTAASGQHEDCSNTGVLVHNLGR